MEVLAMIHHYAIVFGVLGNIISFMVFLAPVRTFNKIIRVKSTEGFQSLPYVVGLFSATLWIYYAVLMSITSSILLVTINSIGCFIEAIYIVIFLIYATRKSRIFGVLQLLLLNVGSFGLIVVFTQLLCHGEERSKIVGRICLSLSIAVFAAPLSIMRRVIKTKSVEYMPFWLSFFLTLSAVVWFLYGLAKKDSNIAVPNVFGFILGVSQIILYMCYKNAKPKEEEIPKSITAEGRGPNVIINIINLRKIRFQVHPFNDSDVEDDDEQINSVHGPEIIEVSSE